MKKILDYFYSLLETYGGKISCWAWNKRWKDKDHLRNIGTRTGCETNESWIDGYRKWKDNLNEKEKDKTISTNQN
jgi:hypothetical protein